jgi:hypothetical protein
MEETFNQKYDKIKARFPDAKFSISCFNNSLEIENKIISSDDVIIYQDCYLKDGKKLNDSFIIKKRPDKEFIYLCDVIDELIRNDFIRNDCDHRYMETIREFNTDKRNSNSIKTYSSFWGS